MIFILLIVCVIITVIAYGFFEEDIENNIISSAITVISFIMVLVFTVSIGINISVCAGAQPRLRKKCILYTRELKTVKSEILKADFIEKINTYNKELKEKQVLNNTFLYDLLISDEITNIKPISIKEFEAKE
jgi:hypothetical protein